MGDARVVHATSEPGPWMEEDRELRAVVSHVRLRWCERKLEPES